MKSLRGRLFIALALSALLTSGSFESISAQQNPFERPDPADAGTPTIPTAPPDADQPGEADATVRAVLTSDLGTPNQLMRGVEILLNIDRDDVAKQLLERLSGLQLTDEQLFDLYRTVGPDAFFRIANRPGLEGTGFAVTQRVLEGAQRYATDDNRLSKLLTEIVSDDIYTRSGALADLRLLGDFGAAALVNMLADPGQRNHWQRIRLAIRHFGNVAEGPLLAAMRGGNAKMRAEASKALGFVQTTASVESLYLPSLSDQTDPIIQRVAVQSLKRLAGALPSLEEAQLRLHRSATNFLMDRYFINRNPDDQVKWWRWDNDQQMLKMAWMEAETASRIRAFQLAADLVQLNPGRDDFQQLYWLTRLETAKLTSGISQPLPAAVLGQLSAASSPEMLMSVLTKALETGRLPAAIAATEVLGVNGSQGLLANAGSTTNPLIKALDHGDTRLTHAAVMTISRWNPVRSFTGSSRYLSALTYLSRASGMRQALVAHVNSQTAQDVGTMLSRAGFIPVVAINSRQVFDLAGSNPDIEVLVITDIIERPGFDELVQALRANPRTSRIPIALLVGPEKMKKAERLARNYPYVTAGRFVLDELSLARQIDNTMVLARRRTTAAQRLEFARDSLDQLAIIAENPDRYAHFDLTNQQDELMFALGTPSLAEKACVVLSRIATPRAQLNLLGTAGNDQLPLDLRRQAAESFAKAVRTKGLMLTRNQILAQYDLYNATAEDSAENQQILGHILDAIEKKLD